MELRTVNTFLHIAELHSFSRTCLLYTSPSSRCPPQPSVRAAS